MRYLAAFRDPALAARLRQVIADEAARAPGRRFHFMEFCGGHTHAIFRHGLAELLPDNVRMVHGPGCPICVLPPGCIDNAVALARRPGLTLCSFGDALRVPGLAGSSLLAAKAEGADVRMVYSPSDALAIARAEPQRRVVFFAVGFETTAPATAVVVQQARAGGVENFAVYCNHVLTPPAIRAILDSHLQHELGPVALDGFIGPAHVSAVIGTRPYECFAEASAKPVVIAGFEPLDVLQAVWRLLRQVNAGQARVENAYRRVVSREGNRKAQALVAEVFELRRSFAWRGLGAVPDSALRLRPSYAAHDVEAWLDLPAVAPAEHPGCRCGAILRGAEQPRECPLFGRSCTPERPVGACMVSAEGACAAEFRYGRPVAEHGAGAGGAP